MDDQQTQLKLKYQIKFSSSFINLNKKKLKAENEKTSTESTTKLSAEIETLSKNIVARNESLANQARSAQTEQYSYKLYQYNCKFKIDYRSYFTSCFFSAMSEVFQQTIKCLTKQIKKLLLKKQTANNEAIVLIHRKSTNTCK